jgi:acetoin utilization deacetylase AcuC-like enzyme
MGLMVGVVEPLLSAFSPEVLLISAGYDAHADDPLADCHVTESGYAAMTRTLLSAAAAVDAPVGVVLEGGYALGALARSVTATMEALAAGPAEAPAHFGEAAAAPLVTQARERLSRWWPELG